MTKEPIKTTKAAGDAWQRLVAAYLNRQQQQRMDAMSPLAEAERLWNGARARPLPTGMLTTGAVDVVGMDAAGWVDVQSPYTKLLKNDLKLATFRPKKFHPEFFEPTWQLKPLPYREQPLPPIVREPIRISDYWLWADPEEQQIYFVLAEPRLLEFSLTVHRTLQPDRSLRITGGAAFLVVSAYADNRLSSIVQLRQSWHDQLERVGFGRRSWQFQPQPLRNLDATLELPAAHKSSEPRVSVGSNGTVTFLVDLSEVGALAWKDALEQGVPHTIPGLCRLKAGFLGREQNNIAVKSQEASAPLGTLLSGRSASDIQIVEPQQTIAATLVVEGHPLLSNVTIQLQPNQGQAPTVAIFDEGGGQIKATVTSQQVGEVAIGWRAQVSFDPPSWPTIIETGTLSLENGWTEIVKPGAWLVNYTILAMLVDAQGSPLPLNQVEQTSYQIQGVLNFTAPYVAGVLTTSFFATHQQPGYVVLPRFPGQAFGDLVMTIFATVQGNGNTATIKLAENANLVIAKVFPTGQIAIHTNQDALPESGDDARLFRRLAQLQASG